MDQEHHSLKRLTVLVITLCVAALSGCPAGGTRPSFPDAASNNQPLPPSTAPPAALPPAVIMPRTPPPPRENHLSPATRSLVTQAQTLMAHGDLDGASSTLDRALRIEPHNPLLWIERGRLRLAENDAHQAEVCGRKALALASGDTRSQSQAGRLLADALRAQKRNQEAREIESQPYMH